MAAKRRLLILAGVTAAEATAMAVCLLFVNRQINRTAGDIDHDYPTPLPAWLQDQLQQTRET